MYLFNANGWQMSSRQLKDAMGFAKDWPREGVKITPVDGEYVFVWPRAKEPLTKGTGVHRAFVLCRHCRMEIPAGRYHQHRKYKHPEWATNK